MCLEKGARGCLRMLMNNFLLSVFGLFQIFLDKHRSLELQES